MVFYDDGHNNTRWIVYWQLDWLGFQARGDNLMRAGWKATEIRKHDTFASMLVLEHPKQKVVMHSSYVDDYTMREIKSTARGGGQLSLGLWNCARDVIINSYDSTKFDLNPVDLSTAHVDQFYFRQQSPFRNLVQENKIIVPDEPDTQALLDMILKKQNPDQVKYFENKVRERQAMPEAKLCQIIQLRA